MKVFCFDKKKLLILFSKVFRKDAAVVEAGQNVGVNLRNIKADSISKGMMLCKPGSFTLTNHFEVYPHCFRLQFILFMANGIHVNF
jgi:translation elongation factor EF-Tu-like GTPase